MPSASPPPPSGRTARPRQPPAGDPNAGHRYRFRFHKIGPAALLSHLDLVRELPRVFRRADMAMVHTGGYHPKPAMSFGPALSLGVASLDEHVDVRLEQSLGPTELGTLVERMNDGCPRGLGFAAAVQLAAGAPGITKVVTGARYLVVVARAALLEHLERMSAPAGCSADAAAWLEARCRDVMARASIEVERRRGTEVRRLQIRPQLLRAEPAGAEALATLPELGVADAALGVEVDVVFAAAGTARPADLAAVLLDGGQQMPLRHRIVRLALLSGPGHEAGPLL
jgi:radical SAM-linked protein